ncbi:hypothetical protein COF68_06275 [Bacillus toyonensis]|nr:hypothetical protein COF68_06275 [Bacillus toyonensis]
MFTNYICSGALTDIYVFKLVFTEDVREDKPKLIETSRFISMLLTSMGVFLVAVFYISEVSPIRLIRFNIVTNLVLMLFLTIIMKIGQSKDSKLKPLAYVTGFTWIVSVLFYIYLVSDAIKLHNIN